MKKVLAILLALMLAGVISALSETTDGLGDIEGEARTICNALVEGDYSAITDRFNDSMSAVVDETMLQQSWEAVIAQYGAFSEVESLYVDEATQSATLRLKHEQSAIILTVAFDDAGLISGLNLRPDAVYEAAEKALPEGVTEVEVVLFEGTDHALNARILHPDNAACDTPYVILVQGSGASDMDETIGPNKPFRDLAYDLAAQGVGSLRFDKITFAHPELSIETVEQEYLEPVTEALRILREESNASRVYVAGHSLGGILTPWLVQSCGFDGGIVLSGTPLPLWQMSYDQNLLVIEGMPEDQRDDLLAQIEAEAEKAKGLMEMSDEEAATTTIFGVSAVYQRSIAQLNEIAIAKETEKPYLFLWGESDFQVNSEAYQAWQDGLGDDPLYTYITYPGLNHLLMPSEEGDSILNVQSAYMRPASIPAQVSADILKWIENNA